MNLDRQIFSSHLHIHTFDRVEMKASVKLKQKEPLRQVEMLPVRQKSCNNLRFIDHLASV